MDKYTKDNPPVIRVFAQKGTDKKYIIMRPLKDIYQGGLVRSLMEKYGGKWLLVETLKRNEHLVINDGLQYNGFDAKRSRYVNRVTTLLFK